MTAKPGPDWEHWPDPPNIPLGLVPPRDDDWWPAWTDPWTGKWMFTFAPDFSGFNPDTGKLWSPKEIVDHLGIKKASGDETRTACEKVVAANPDKVAVYRAGKTNMIGFFIKLVMDETKRQASPQEATQILTELLRAP